MADRYWVGGSGNSNDTAHWSASSGGAGGASVPTSSDSAIFDAGSNTTNAGYTWTLAATFNCLDLQFLAKPGDGAGGTITLAGTAAVNIYGSLTLLAGMPTIDRGDGAQFNFKATSTGKTITTNGVALSRVLMTFDGVGGGWTLQDALVGGFNASPFIVLTNGSLDTNGKAVAFLYMYSTGSATRSLTLGASVLTSNWGSATYAWRINATGMTFSGASSTINLTNIEWFEGGGLPYGTLNLPGGASRIYTANTFANLTMIGGAAKTHFCALYANQTVTGILTITGNSETNRLLVQSDTMGTARAITCTNPPVLSNCDFMDIAGAGAGGTWKAAETTGTELITNAVDRDFSGTGNWALGTGFSVGAGVMSISGATNGVGSSLSNAYVPFTSGRPHSITFTVKNYVGGVVRIRSANGLAATTGVSANGTYTQTINLDGTYVLVQALGTTTLDVDDISIKEVSSLGDALGNSGITFTPAATQYWKTPTTGTKNWGTVGNWFMSTNGGGGAGRVPLPQDNVVFDANSIGAASTTVSADMPRSGKDWTFVGVTNTPIVQPNTANNSEGSWCIHGSLTLSAGMLFNTIWLLTLRGRGSHTITMAGGAFNAGFVKRGPGGTYTMQDALITSSVDTYFYDGTFDTGGYALTFLGAARWRQAGGTVNLNNSLVTIAGQQGGAVFIDTGTGTINAGTSTIKLTDATATAKQFQSAGRTFNNIELAGAGSGAFTFTGSNTFADFKVSNGAKTIKFTAGTTTAIASATGFEDNAATFDTVSGAGTFTLTKSGGGTVKMRGASVTRSTASPAATFYAGATGTDGGGNTNWTFNNAPATASLIATDADNTAAAATINIVAGADIQDQAETAVAAGVVSIAAALDAIDSHELLFMGTVQIGAALSALDDDEHLAATSAVQIGAALALTDDDDTLAASAYIWRLINDARYLKPVTSNRNIGPVKGIQL